MQEGSCCDDIVLRETCISNSCLPRDDETDTIRERDRTTCVVAAAFWNTFGTTAIQHQPTTDEGQAMTHRHLSCSEGNTRKTQRSNVTEHSSSKAVRFQIHTPLTIHTSMVFQVERTDSSNTWCFVHFCSTRRRESTSSSRIPEFLDVRTRYDHVVTV